MTIKELKENASHLESRVLKREREFDHGFLKIDKLTLDMPDGNTAQQYKIEHPGAVAVIAIDDDGKVLLVRQWRSSIEETTVEIPAGKIDPGEDIMETAIRELKEETGYSAEKVEFLFESGLALGYSSEILYFFKAEGLSLGDQDLDEDEFIDVFFMDENELLSSVMANEIKDSKTIIAALAYQHIFDR